MDISMDEINRTFAPRITPTSILELRKAMRYSQREFGIEISKMSGPEVTPYTPGYISNLENGRQPITEIFEEALRYLIEVHQAGGAIRFVNGRIQYYYKLVTPGSLYSGQSKACKWDDCENSFIPTSPNQKQCPECKQRKR